MEFSADDARGASAIRDAVRSMRILNHMSRPDAELAGIEAFNRVSYFRIDRGKGNYTPPARNATWCRFENVELANGDEVGVVVPWEFPGQGELTPEKSKAYEHAETIFLQLLDRFTAERLNVSNRPSPNFAPSRFAGEPEAKAASLSKAALQAAMERLLRAGRIRSEEFTPRKGRTAYRLARTLMADATNA
jgi:hypothetical protein